MRRIAHVLAATVVLCAAPATAQTARTPEFTYAENAFNENYELRQRTAVQMFLITTGHQNSVPTERFSLRTYGALQRFQRENGMLPDGVVNKATWDRLGERSIPLLKAWDFRLVGHPTRGRPIWMPQGLDVRPIPDKNGIAFRDPGRRLHVSYDYFPGVEIVRSYDSMLVAIRSGGARINYSTIKDGWYVISATGNDGVDQYLRYQQDGDGVLGFQLFWNNSHGQVYGERIAILMSASFGSVMNGRPFVEPLGEPAPGAMAQAPQRTTPAVARVEAAAIAPIPTPAPAPVTPQAPVPPVAPKVEEKGVSTGTGFFVDDKGSFVSNAHVISDCKTVLVKLADNTPAHKARVLATDTTNDLAILMVEGISNAKFAQLRIGARLGEGVAAFGYPHTDILATSGNFTLGNLTALAGIGDDSRYYQISAPVQQGNSGGPLLDNYGNAVGVVSSKLNIIKMAAASGDFAQNVNFAIKSAILSNFLETNRITATIGTASTTKLDPADLADAAKAMSGFVACQ